ncbi:MAG: (d)CMP kinase [Patescibacteria group bacterium]
MNTPTPQDKNIPVITFDGGAGTGKGTIRARLAKTLGFHGLDSGVLYRALGLVCHKKDLTDMNDIVNAALTMNIHVDGDTIYLDGVDETATIRSNFASHLAHPIARIPEVRLALREFQIHMRKHPGLVADGRDQGFIFDDAVRFFFTAKPEVVAERSVHRSKQHGIIEDYETVLKHIHERNESDRTRVIDPMIPHPEAIHIDTTELTPDEVHNLVLLHLNKKGFQL